jgi:diacylglycerol O-acyltransferase
MVETRELAPKRRLSGVDASFLYLDRKEIPLNMAAVCIFDRPIPFDDFVRTVDSKLHTIPRYRQIVVPAPYNLGYPTWEDDPNFRIRRHIFRAHVEPPGGQEQLEELAGRILSRLMDRSKPLWDIHVIEGLENGGGALILRIHHSMADGLSGVQFLSNVVLSPTPDVSPPARKPRRELRPISKPSLLGAVFDGIRSSVEHLVTAEVGLFDFAQDLLTSPSRIASAASMVPENLGVVERLPFNKPCSGDRKFCWADLDLEEVKAIRAVAGGSVNDVVLTVLTRAVARYVELHGQSTTRRLIRIVCPVNIRKDNGESLGNQITFMPVTLPLDVKDPVANLQAVAARTAAAKATRSADLIAIAASFLGAAPPPLQAAMWQGISHLSLPVPLLNMICTNLPGSPVPFYCRGSRMTAAYLQVPTGYELGINCAVQSYCGKLLFGLIADAHVAPDVTRLRDFLYVAFEELCVAAGVRKPARKTAPRKARHPKPATAAEAAIPKAAPQEVRKRRPRRTAPAGPMAAPPVERAAAMAAGD